MSKQLHNQFSTREVTEILEKYLARKVETDQALRLLKIGRSRFFSLLKTYRDNPNDFSIKYKRKGSNRKIDAKTEKAIVKELEKEKQIIEDKQNPVRNYNYSYLKNHLQQKRGIEVSLSTIINRAKKMGFTKDGSRRRFMTERF